MTRPTNLDAFIILLEAYREGGLYQPHELRLTHRKTAIILDKMRRSGVLIAAIDERGALYKLTAKARRLVEKNISLLCAVAGKFSIRDIE